MSRSLSEAVVVAVVLSLVVVAPVGVVGAVGSSTTVSGTATTAPSGAAALSDATACSFPVTRTDATGAEVTVDADPDRVVVLQPSAAQVMWELDASEEVVGMPVKYYTTYLEGAENKTNVVNDDGSTNVERVVAQEPDLVLAPHIVPNETVRQLRSDGLTVFKFSFGRSLSTIYAKTELVGELTGNCENAQRTVSNMKAEVESVREIAADGPTPEVLFYMPGNYTAGEGTFINEVIETAGGENVAVEAGISGYKPISQEVVVEADPEVIVVQEGLPLPEDGVHQSTFAVRHDQVVTVDRNYISQPAPRVVIPMRTMAEAFADAQVKTPTPTPTSTATSTAPADEVTTTDGSGAGFGVAAALVAALVAAFLVVWRP